MTAATQAVTVGAAWMRAGLILLLVVAAVLVAVLLAQLVRIVVDAAVERRARKYDTQPYDPETEAAITQALAVQDTPVRVIVHPGVLSIDEAAKLRALVRREIQRDGRYGR